MASTNPLREVSKTATSIGDSDNLTICNDSKDEEPGETDASVTVCVYMTLYIVVLRCFLNYEMSII